MKKIAGYSIMTFAVVFGVIFFFLLNLSFLLREGQLKKTLEDSNFYDTAAFYIKNEIVTNTEFKLNEGSNFEDLNQSITANNVKASIDDAIAQAFSALKNPTDSNKVFPVNFYTQDTARGAFSFEKYVNFQNNEFFNLLANKDTLLLETGGVALILFLIGIVIVSSRLQDRMMLAGLGILGIALFLLAIGLLLKEYSGAIANGLIEQSNLFKEPKLIAVVKRISILIANRQAIFYTMESVGLLVLSIILFSLRRIFVKEHLADIEEKI